MTANEIMRNDKHTCIMNCDAILKEIANIMASNCTDLLCLPVNLSNYASLYPSYPTYHAVVSIKREITPC